MQNENFQQKLVPQAMEDLSTYDDMLEDGEIVETSSKPWNIVKHVRDPMSLTSHNTWYNGTVIRVNMTYEKRPCNVNTESFSHIYSPTLGIIRVMNRKNQKNMEMGKSYRFKINDYRRNKKDKDGNKIQIHKPAISHVTVRNGWEEDSNTSLRYHSIQQKIIINTTFKINDLHFEDELPNNTFRFHNQHLNWITVPACLVNKINKRVRKYLEDELEVDVVVKLCCDYLPKFLENENSPIFTVIYVNYIINKTCNERLFL